MEKLFEDKDRFDDSPGHHIDNTFDFLDRSSIKEIATIRDTLNGWYGRYPKNEKAELKARFPKSFNPTLYELFIHELFTRQGFILEVHPAVPGSTKNPDFLARKNGQELYIEAIDIMDKSQAEVGIENKMNTLYDGLNKINSPNFFLGIRKLNLKSSQQPSVRGVNSFIEEKLQDYNPDKIDEALRKGELNELPTIRYEDDNMEIVVSLLTKIPSARGVSGIRPIGAYPLHSFIGGSDETIRSAMERKAKKYGLLDKPYLICVNSSNGAGANDHSVMNALFGSLAVTWSTNPNNRDERWERGHDGFFRDSKGPQFTRMSGVLITNVHLGNSKEPKHWLVKHPFASKELDFTTFELSHLEVREGKITEISKKAISDLLSSTDS